MRQVLTFSVAGTILVSLLASCAGVREVAEPETRGHLVVAYHPWWMRDTWREFDRGLYDEVLFFSVDLDSTGGIAQRNGWPDRWFAMQRELTESGLRVKPAVTLFSQRAFERLFSHPDSSAVLESSLLGLLRDSPAAGGLHLDFEIYRPVSPDVRSGFTDFVGRLREAMSGLRPGLSLSLYLLAYDESDVYDEEVLARHADYVVVQGYDLHGRTEDRTGPVAGLHGWGRRNWSYVVDRFVNLGVPREKIVMSVPYFGYEWPAVSDQPGARTVGRGVTISVAPVDSAYVPESRTSARERAERYGVRRDLTSGSPYYTYEDATGWRQGWYEDEESLAAKYDFVKASGIRGVAIFHPAYGDEELHDVLRRAFRDVGSSAYE